MSEYKIPRRSDISRSTPAENEIRRAVEFVEGMGCHPLLTEAVILLDQAREKVADYVDLTPPAEERDE